VPKEIDEYQKRLFSLNPLKIIKRLKILSTYQNQLLHKLEEITPDVIWVLNWRGVLTLNKSARILGIKLVYQIGLGIRKSFFGSLFNNFLLNKSDFLILESNYQIKTLFTNYQINKHKHKFIVIPMGIDLIRFSSKTNYEKVISKQNKRHKIIGIVASLNKRKGIDVLIKALNVLKSNSSYVFDLFLIGDDSTKEKKYKQHLIEVVNLRNDYDVYLKDVLYLISTNHNYNVFTDPYIDVETNLIDLIRVLESWKNTQGDQNGVFNFVSSWFVYGDNGCYPSKETDPCNPKGFYSITKRAAEQLLISYCVTFNLNYRIFRLANVIGENDPKASAQKNALQYMINLMKKGERIELYEGGDGDFVRDFIHVDDCVRAMDILLQGSEKNTIYNVGNGIPVRFGELIKFAHGEIQSTSEIVDIQQKSFHKKVQVKSFYMDNSLLKSLGYVPTYSAEDAVRDMI
jgi:nucleoside-diphosphate-sugar epimerase